ncbi:MAG: sugar ABC transporter permease [Devosia sp.]|jgi:multiple sugar transport system permease protein|uniref:carbohydrate ABC transporter permease n=1 Tax=Devosia sp. TaxID=1871048 RepID=UPI001A602FDB|nr:sugar ABC transporter permease [Devosia sp.]MBL8596727.1 sugar ABC transporter permease [Devosia sp.]
MLGRLLRDDRKVGLLFLIPGVAALLFTYVVPLLYSLGLSLADWDIRRPGSQWAFAGLDNYLEVLTSDAFWEAGGRSLVYTLVALPVQLVLGTLVALLLTDERINGKLSALTRVLLLIPLMLPPVVLGILWRLLLNVNYGPINHLLGLVGIEPLTWVSAPDTAMMAVIMVEVISNTCVVAMILIGGILSLPVEPLRAAEVDGAGPLRILFEIKLPQLASYYLIIILIRLMDLLKTFDFIYALTGGGPGEATLVLNLYIYRVGQRFLDYPLASAASWIFLIILLPLSIWLLLRAVSSSREYLND